jgi:WD40 repeat protein
VFNLEKPGREKFAARVATFSGKPGVNCMAWSSQRM